MSAGKVIALVFWGAKGVIIVDYLAKGETINSVFYCTLLRRLCEIIKEKRPRLLNKKMLFHQDNACVHTSVESMAQIRDCVFELLPHPANSPDLAPSGFNLFSNLKKQLWGKNFHQMRKSKLQRLTFLEALKKLFLWLSYRNQMEDVPSVKWRLREKIKFLFFIFYIVFLLRSWTFQSILVIFSTGHEG